MKRFLSLWERVVRFMARLIGIASLSIGIFIYATSHSLLGMGILGILAVTTYFMWWPTMAIVSALSVVAIFVLHEHLFVIIAVTYVMFTVFGAIASRKRAEARWTRRLARKAARTQN